MSTLGRRYRWLTLAVVAGLLGACSSPETALYRSDKYVPGYVPTGQAIALAAAR